MDLPVSLDQTIATGFILNKMALAGPSAYFNHSVQTVVFSSLAVVLCREYPAESSDTIWPGVVVIYTLLAASFGWLDKVVYKKEEQSLRWIMTVLSGGSLTGSSYFIFQTGYTKLAMSAFLVGALIILVGTATTISHLVRNNEPNADQ